MQGFLALGIPPQVITTTSPALIAKSTNNLITLVHQLEFQEQNCKTMWHNLKQISKFLVLNYQDLD